MRNLPEQANANKPIGPNVLIWPAVLPHVDRVLDDMEIAINEWEQLTPHLEGAFTSLHNSWEDATAEQKQALLARSPRLVRAMGLARRLRPLIDDVPDLEI
jgi:hypothetical protein